MVHGVVEGHEGQESCALRHVLAQYCVALLFEMIG